MSKKKCTIKHKHGRTAENKQATKIPGNDRESEAFWKINLWNTMGICDDNERGKWNAVLLSLAIPHSPWDFSLKCHRTGIHRPSSLVGCTGSQIGHIQCNFSLNTCRTTNISVILRLHGEEKSRKCWHNQLHKINLLAIIAMSDVLLHGGWFQKEAFRQWCWAAGSGICHRNNGGTTLWSSASGPDGSEMVQHLKKVFSHICWKI